VLLALQKKKNLWVGHLKLILGSREKKKVWLKWRNKLGGRRKEGLCNEAFFFFHSPDKIKIANKSAFLFFPL
jgi:hypothetical protein